MKKIIGMLTLFAVVVACNSVSARELMPKEKSIIETAARQQLKDPDSAKFYWQDYKGGEIYCGHVNAKNSYGGYAGKALLMVGVKTNSKGEVMSAETSIKSGEMEKLMAPICTEAGYQP